MLIDRRFKPRIRTVTQEISKKSVNKVTVFEHNRVKRSNLIKSATVEIQSLELDPAEERAKIQAAKAEINQSIPRVIAPTEIHTGAAGSGKTTAFLDAFSQEDYSVAYYVGTNNKLDELQEDRSDVEREIPRNGLLSPNHWKGVELSLQAEENIDWWRQYKADGSPRAAPLREAVPACVFVRKAIYLGFCGLSIRNTLCERCPLKDYCEYYAQTANLQSAFDANKTIIRTHHRMQAGSLIDQGHIRLIDEAFLASMISPHSIPAQGVDGRDGGLLALLGPSAGADAASLINAIARSVEAHPSEPLRLENDDYEIMGKILNRLSKAEDRARGVLHPHHGRFGQLMERVEKHGYRWLKPIKELFRQARKCIKHEVPMQSAKIATGQSGAELHFLEIRKPDIGRDDALIILDATAEIEILRHIFPERRFDVVTPQCDHNLDVLHVVMPATNSSVGCRGDHSKVPSKAGLKNLKFIERQNREWGLHGRVGVFSNKKVSKIFQEHLVTSFPHFGTFGSLRGVNSFEECDSAMVYGQAARSHKDLEQVAGALNLVDGVFPRKLETWDGREDDEAGLLLPVDDRGLYFHPDALTYAVYRLQVVGEVIQSVGRLRAVQKQGRTRVVVYGLHDLSELGESLLSTSYGMERMPRTLPEHYVEDELQNKGWCLNHPLAFTAWMNGVSVEKGMAVDQFLVAKNRQTSDELRTDFASAMRRKSHMTFVSHDAKNRNKLKQVFRSKIYTKTPAIISCGKLYADRHGKFFDDNGLRRKIDQKIVSVLVKHDQKLSTAFCSIQKQHLSTDKVPIDKSWITEDPTYLTVITGPPECATKAFDKAPSGIICPLRSIPLPSHWRGGHKKEVRSLWDVQAHFEDHIHANTSAAVIRGAWEGKRPRHFERRAQRRGGIIRDVKSRLVSFDIDDFMLPDGLDVVDDAEMVARALPAAMGYPFNEAQCLVSWSASCGIRKRRIAKAHLWFWLDRPMTTAEVREMVKAKADDLQGKKARFNLVTVDLSTLTEVHMLFEGPPVLFDDIPDPMPSRMVMIEGGELDLSADRPDPVITDWQPNVDDEEIAERQEEERRERIERAKLSGKATLAKYQAALTLIGDDAEGFHNPILKAVGVARALIDKGESTDEELHAMLELAVFDAPAGNRDVAYIEDEASWANFERLLEWHEERPPLISSSSSDMNFNNV